MKAKISVLRPRRSYYFAMWWTNTGAARSAGFFGFQSIGELRRSNSSDVPRLPGVYLIISPTAGVPTFLPNSTGGHFKGKDPTVPMTALREKWVAGSVAVYVGKAGGDNSAATLRSRLKQYVQFGAGIPIGHWGGRYIWQMESSEALVVAWKPTEDQSPLAIEQEMLDTFTVSFGKLPFANCRR